LVQLLQELEGRGANQENIRVITVVIAAQACNYLAKNKFDSELHPSLLEPSKRAVVNKGGGGGGVASKMDQQKSVSSFLQYAEYVFIHSFCHLICYVPLFSHFLPCTGPRFCVPCRDQSVLRND